MSEDRFGSVAATLAATEQPVDIPLEQMTQFGLEQLATFQLECSTVLTGIHTRWLDQRLDVICHRQLNYKAIDQRPDKSPLSSEQSSLRKFDLSALIFGLCFLN